MYKDSNAPDNIILNVEAFTNERMYHHYKSIANRAVEVGHEEWIAGFPVHPKLHEFVSNIRAKRRDFVFDGGAVVYRTKHGESYRVHSTLDVAFADLPHQPVGDARVDEDGNFVVYSQQIQNDKYAIHNPMYRTRKSKDMKRMLKVAAQYFKPFDVSTLMSRHSYDLHKAVTTVRSPHQEKFTDKLALDPFDVMNELQNMIAVGYTPTNSAFLSAMKLVAEEGADIRRLKDYRPRTCFVWAKQKSLVYKFSDVGAAEVEVTSMEEVPEILRDKLAVLNMADKESPIADVGVRLSANTFWVFV